MTAVEPVVVPALDVSSLRTAAAPEAQGRGVRGAAQRTRLGNERKNPATGGLTSDDAAEEIEAWRANRAMRRLLWRLLVRDRDGAGKVTTLPGLENCGALRANVERPGMSLRRTRSGKLAAGLTGTQRCHSKACPNCLPVDAQEDATELTKVAVHVMHQGGALLHLTATARHRRGDPLDITAARVQAGMSAILQSAFYRELREFGVHYALKLAAAREAVGPDGLRLRQRETRARVAAIKAEAEATGHRLLCWAAAREQTYGIANGWHPHQHQLLYVHGVVDMFEAVQLQVRLLEVYRAGLAAFGGSCDDFHGLVVEVATTRRDAETLLARYLTKVCLEVTRGDLKAARNAESWDMSGPGPARGTVEERLTPWEMLRRIAEDREFERFGWSHASKATLRYVALWREFEKGTAGRARMSHGGDWSALLEAAEECQDPECVRWREVLTPEEAEPAPVPAPGEENAPPVEWTETPDRITWRADDHDAVRRALVEVFGVAERDGWSAVFDELARRGVAWQWVNPAIPAEPDDLSDLAVGQCWTVDDEGMVRTTDHHQGQGCECWTWGRLPRAWTSRQEDGGDVTGVRALVGVQGTFPMDSDTDDAPF